MKSNYYNCITRLHDSNCHCADNAGWMRTPLRRSSLAYGTRTSFWTKTTAPQSIRVSCPGWARACPSPWPNQSQVPGTESLFMPLN